MKYEILLTELIFPFKRMSLKKDWVKAKLNPNTKVEVCTHENKVAWDCGCSWGCDCCSYSFHCNDCNSKLVIDFLPYAKLIKS